MTGYLDGLEDLAVLASLLDEEKETRKNKKALGSQRMETKKNRSRIRYFT